jgi:hypothetical protein
MAKSRSVHHEEAPAASPLLTAFLILSAGWMALGALLGG